ncbi:hypothetical protein ACLOJK_019711 [Asimina triloba]
MMEVEPRPANLYASPHKQQQRWSVLSGNEANRLDKPMGPAQKRTAVAVAQPSPVAALAWRRRPNPEVSPAAFASLLLGIALALMLCGSVTFVIGFILMPWVLGLIMVFYVVGFVANLSVLGRAILLGTAAGPAAPSANPTCTKELSGVAVEL